MLDYHERADERLAEIDRTLKGRKGKDAIHAEQRLEMHEPVREPPQADRVDD